MGNIIRSNYKRYNGKDFDTMYFATSADQIVEGVITSEKVLNYTNDRGRLVDATLIKALLDKKADNTDLYNGLTYKGSCTYNELTSNNDCDVGDFYFVTDDDKQCFYAWNGTEWHNVGNGYSNMVTQEQYESANDAILLRDNTTNEVFSLYMNNNKLYADKV